MVASRNGNESRDYAECRSLTVRDCSSSTGRIKTPHGIFQIALGNYGVPWVDAFSLVATDLEILACSEKCTAVRIKS